jgi:nuclear pore complex protein Nup160
MILWRASHDVLELVETSLDWDLRNNRIKYKFQDTPLLAGVSIHETFHHIVILVATVSSVHKLVFTHPKCVHKQDLDNYYNTNEGFPSILAEATGSTPVDHFYVIPGTGVGK